jgi:hypothetical protein
VALALHIHRPLPQDGAAIVRGHQNTLGVVSRLKHLPSQNKKKNEKKKNENENENEYRRTH